MKTISEKYGATDADTTEEEITLINAALDQAYAAGDTWAVSKLEDRRRAITNE